MRQACVTLMTILASTSVALPAAAATPANPSSADPVAADVDLAPPGASAPVLAPGTTPTGTTKNEPVETLTMAIALAKASRNNPTLVTRRLAQELFEINYDEAWRKMWLPSVGVNTTFGAAYTLEQIPGSQSAAQGSGGRNHGNPLSTTALQVGAFNIYNFGRDADTLKSAQLEVERSRENLHEVERGVRFQVIQSVFNFKTRQDLLDAAQRSVDSSEAVYELVKSRLALGRATKADLASSEIDMLNARSALLQNQTAYSEALWALNLVLGDPIGHPYKVRTEVKFIKFRMSLDEILAIYKRNAPAIKDAVKALEQRRAELRIAEKNALPLPVIQFSGINFGYNFTPRGTTPNREPGNWEYTVGLNITIPIIGDGGFLFSRALRAAEIRAESAELDLINTANSNDVQTRNLYTSLMQAELSVELNQKIFKQASEFFDAALAQLQSNSAFNRLDLKSALEQLRSAEINLTSSILDHYNLKLQIANLIGVDRFPEENL